MVDKSVDQTVVGKVWKMVVSWVREMACYLVVRRVDSMVGRSVVEMGKRLVNALVDR